MQGHIAIFAVRTLVLFSTAGILSAFILYGDPNSVCADRFGNDACTRINCTAVEAKVYCPIACGYCLPCIDANDTNCENYRKFCHIPQFHEITAVKCPVTCGLCDESKSTTAVGVTLKPTTTIVTTTSKPTTPTTTIPPLPVRRCDKFGLVTDVAMGSLVSSKESPPCKDGVHQPSAAVVQTHCNAPSVNGNWNIGPNVLANCDKIPAFTAIVGFQLSFDNPIAAVFIACDSGTIQVAIQTCVSSLNIIHINKTSNGVIPDADKFFILEWN